MRSPEARRPDILDYGRWLAVQDARGLWIVVDAGTRQPVLRCSDPYLRMVNVHMAAAAPMMRSALEGLLRKLENAHWKEETGDWRRGRILQFAWCALFDCVPDFSLARPLLVSRQHELPLDSDSEEEAA